MTLSISVIIPTYNRADDLSCCLESLYRQTIKPQEILVVDDSDNDDTFRLTEYFNKKFRDMGVAVKYIKNHREKSSAVARNIGVEASKGEIIVFLDDDVILMNDYIERILEVYQTYPDCLGVQGHIILKEKLGKFNNILGKLFFHSHLEEDSCRVLPSTNTTYPYPLRKIIQCEWMSGANQSYKSHVLKKFRFNENFKRYSYKEDMDLSYTIYKNYGRRLYMTPYAKLIHKTSQKSRMPTKELIFMREFHSVYLFIKHIENTPKNISIFVWSKLGYLLHALMSLIIRPYTDIRMKCLLIKYLITAYILCLTHIKEIQNGNFNFLETSSDSSLHISR